MRVSLWFVCLFSDQHRFFIVGFGTQSFFCVLYSLVDSLSMIVRFFMRACSSAYFCLMLKVFRGWLIPRRAPARRCARLIPGSIYGGLVRWSLTFGRVPVIRCAHLLFVSLCGAVIVRWYIAVWSELWVRLIPRCAPVLCCVRLFLCLIRGWFSPGDRSPFGARLFSGVFFPYDQLSLVAHLPFRMWSFSGTCACFPICTGSFMCASVRSGFLCVFPLLLDFSQRRG